MPASLPLILTTLLGIAYNFHWSKRETEAKIKVLAKSIWVLRDGIEMAFRAYLVSKSKAFPLHCVLSLSLKKKNKPVIV